MSQCESLIYTEKGRIIPDQNEELTFHRRARKQLTLHDVPARDSTVHFLARRYARCTDPLIVAINGHRLEYRTEHARDHYWGSLSVPRDMLKPGDNYLDFWTAGRAQQAWTLAIEDGHPSPQSFLSLDAGKSWQNQHMGTTHQQIGEYIVRLRIPGLPEASPPEFAWEPPEQPRLKELKALLPAEVTRIADPWQRARALASWVSCAWPYRNPDDGAYLYAPWDPFTILAPTDHAAQLIRMCVHYGVVFVSAATACGIPARCLVCSGDLHGTAGHFFTEVWDERYSQWAAIDPNADVVFIENGRPLGALELYERGDELRRLAQFGPGEAFHSARLGKFIDQYVLSGQVFRLLGVWPRNDFFSRPELTPPAHGCSAYSETEIVWRRHGTRGDELGMFPWHAGDEWFARPPKPSLKPSR